MSELILPTAKRVLPGKLHADSPASRRMRRRLIADTVEAFNTLHPNYMRVCVEYLQEITKVQKREWRTGRGELKLQLPQDLFLTLRRIFKKVMPDEPRFGDIDSDIDLLTQVAPKLVPPVGGARANRGRAAR